MRHQIRARLLCCFGMVLLAACSSPPNDGAPVNGEFPPPYERDCLRGGYVCSLGELSDAVLARGESLMFELVTELQGGATLSDIVGIALSQSDVVEARIDGTGMAMYFLLAGGTPMFVYDSDLEATAGTTWANAPVRFDATEPIRSNGQYSPQAVVGDGTHRDEADGTQRKNALVLAPFHWQFTVYDSGPAVEKLLRSTHDYSHAWVGFPIEAGEGISYHVNTAWSDFNVTIHDFTGWHAYDFIFVSTHSRELECSGFIFKVCENSIDVGYTDQPCSVWRNEFPDLDGINCGTTTTTTLSGAPIFRMSLSSDFFADLYGGKNALDRAVVIFDSCQSLKNVAFGWFLAGQTSAFFGWTATVMSNESKATTLRFLWDLLEGQTTASAYARLKRTGLHERTPVDESGQPVFTKIGPHDDELRIIDLPSLRHPTRGVRLQKGASVPIIGVAGDLEDDQLAFVVDVTGVIDPDDTDGGIGTSQATKPADLYNLTFFVDDQVVGHDNLGSPRNPTAEEPEQLDDVTYRYRFTADLPFDVHEDGREVTLKVEVHLPEGGISAHEADVTLTGQPPCSFAATVSGPHTLFAGSHQGFAFRLGMISVSAVNSEWEAQFEQPKELGVHEDVEVRALASMVEDPQNPGSFLYWYATGLGTVTVTRVEDALIEGSLSAPNLLWNYDGGFDTPLDVELTFRAVPYDIGHDSPYRLCRAYWGIPLQLD